MKKSIFFLLAALVPLLAPAQKYALIDMEYILKNIPTYEIANEQIQQASNKWQIEVDAKFKEVQTMYKDYQLRMATMNDEMKLRKEEEVLKNESAAKELQKKYFGPEGELSKRRDNLMKPIQDEIYNAIKFVSDTQGYLMVIDRASSQNIIFASPRIDISDDVLRKLGYSK